jgi:hypothetical protein
MNWTTLYITGRADFRDEVRDKLADSKLDFMPGYVDGSTGNGIYDLYWINEHTKLRQVKEAIGGKLVFKYRLRFYTDLEEFIETTNQDESDDDERDLLALMRQSA